MIMQRVIDLFGPVSASKGKPLKAAIKHLGSGRIGHIPGKRPPRLTSDPYLLLLLADQELVAGREEQARYLVEAAYEHFDRNAGADVRRLFLAG
jgi:hypothetical protein